MTNKFKFKGFEINIVGAFCKALNKSGFIGAIYRDGDYVDSTVPHENQEDAKVDAKQLAAEWAEDWN